jgi:hypothetical protein
VPVTTNNVHVTCRYILLTYTYRLLT